MDRSQFLCIAMIIAGLSMAQLGCEGETPGEYRTFAESQSADRFDEETEAIDPATDSVVVEGDADGDALIVSPDSRPIEPALTEDVEIANDENAEGAGVDAGSPVGAEKLKSKPVTENADDSAALALTGPTKAKASRPDFQAEITDFANPTSLTDLPEVPVESRQIELLVPEMTFKSEGPEQAIRVSYDDLDLLKVLNMEPVPEDAASHFPKWLSDLDGERIRIRGFMYPAFSAVDLPGFVLARDNQICCFGRSPKIYDLIEVAMRSGITTDYIQGRPFDVVGVLHFNPEWNADVDDLIPLYQMDDAIVIDR